MKVVIDREAQEEARQLVSWYAERSPESANRLESEIIASVERIARNPLEFPLMETRGNPGDVRRAKIRDFPVLVIYQVLSDEAIVVGRGAHFASSRLLAVPALAIVNPL